MQHLKNSRKFKREAGQRRALFKTMLGSLIMREKIETTEAKAKEIKGIIDRIVCKAKLGQDEKKKQAIVRYLSDRLPKMAVKKLSGEFVARFSKRNSGFTRVIKLPIRKSDAAKMAIIEFVD